MAQTIKAFFLFSFFRYTFLLFFKHLLGKPFPNTSFLPKSVSKRYCKKKKNVPKKGKMPLSSELTLFFFYKKGIFLVELF